MLTQEQKEAIARVGAICGDIYKKRDKGILKLVYADGARIYGTNSVVLFAEELTIPAGFYTPGGARVKDSPFLTPLKYSNIIPAASELIEPDEINQYIHYVEVCAGAKKTNFNIDFVKQAAEFLNGVYKAYIASDYFRLVLKNGYRTAVIASCRVNK